MIRTHYQQAQVDNAATENATVHEIDPNQAQSRIQALAIPPQLHLHHQIIAHHPRAGLNPIVDAASYLFTLMDQLKTSKSHRALNKLQRDLIHEINLFQETIKTHGYNTEYVLVCRYVICAAIDDLIESTTWGGHKQWESYCLLAAFNQDARHQEKFFSVMERAIKEPAYYIDLMELMYICLSMGYRGRYRSPEFDIAELEQITNSLYKHISAHRGSFSKSLSPTPLKNSKSSTRTLLRGRDSNWTIALITACIIMTIFIGLGYLTEMISNEAISNITDIQKTPARDTFQQ
jgi:type VI secretion system protein ImpK